MNTADYPKAGLQRLFQKGADNFVLLHKNGKAVAISSAYATETSYFKSASLSIS